MEALRGVDIGTTGVTEDYGKAWRNMAPMGTEKEEEGKKRDRAKGACMHADKPGKVG